MIKEIFLPEKFRNRRLISQRIIGLSIEESMITASQVYAAKNSTALEKLVTEPIKPGTPGSYPERAAEAIKIVLSKLDSYDRVKISIPSNIITFKELHLPFTELEKIKMVIDYEVEPLLPFTIQEAIVDFIITGFNKEEKKSQILTAAVRKKDLQKIFEVYKLAGLDPDSVTIDLFSLYGFYLQIPEYSKLKGATALVDIRSRSTNVAFILNKELRLVRTIPKGIQSIAESISNDTGKTVPEILKNIQTLGGQNSGDSEYEKTVQKYMTSLVTDIQFTLNSFSLKLNFYEPMSKILFIGSEPSNQTENNGAPKIRGFKVSPSMVEFLSNILQVPCEQFSCDKIFQTKHFVNKTKRVPETWSTYAVALGTAATYDQHDSFNLRKKDFAKTHIKLLTKQLFTAGVIVIALFSLIVTRGFFQINTLKTTMTKQEKKAIRQLKKIFPPKHPALKKKALTSILREAESEIEDREEAWRPFIQENLQPLEILKDLTETMDRRSFNTKIEKMTIELDEDLGTPLVEVLGVFASQPGRHFSDYDNFIKFFEQNSKMLSIKETDDEPIEDEGVRFSLTLKLKEQMDSVSSSGDTLEK